MSNQTLQRLIMLAERETCDDCLEEGEFYDACQADTHNDAWEFGFAAGETSIAREVLNYLGVDWDPPCDAT